MACVIIAIPKREAADRIAGSIKRRGLNVEVFFHSSPSGILGETQFASTGLVICTEKIQGMRYTELFEYLPHGFGMILLSRHPGDMPLDERFKLLTLPFPMQQLLDLIAESLYRKDPARRKKKKIRIQRTPEEQQMIDQAKEILMATKELTEPEAHSMLQKQSMDTGKTLVESAQMILLLHGEW